MYKFSNPYADTSPSELDNTGAGALFRDAKFADIDSDPNLQQHLFSKYDPDGTEFNGDVQKLKDYVQNQGTTTQSSLILSGGDWIKSEFEDEGEQQDQNLIGRLYESSDDRLFSGDFGKASDAVISGLKGQAVDLGAMLLAAPLTGGMSVVGGVIGKVGGAAKWASRLGNPLATSGKAIAAQSLGRESVRTAIRAGDGALASRLAAQGVVTGSMKRHAIRGAMSEAAMGVAASGLNQGAQLNREIRDEFSWGEAALEAGAGAAFGGLLGGAAGAFAGKGIRDEITGAAQAGLPGSKIDDPSLTVPGAMEDARIEAAAEADNAAQEAARADADAQGEVEAEIPDLPLFGEFITDQLRQDSSLATTKAAGMDGEGNVIAEMRRVANLYDAHPDKADPRGFRSDTIRLAARHATSLRETLASRLERLHADAVVASGNEKSVKTMDKWVDEADDLVHLHRLVRDNPQLLDSLRDTELVSEEFLEALAAVDQTGTLARMMGSDRAAKVAADEAAELARLAEQTQNAEDIANAAQAQAAANNAQATAASAGEPPTGGAGTAEGGAPSPADGVPVSPEVDPNAPIIVSSDGTATVAQAQAETKASTGPEKIVVSRDGVAVVQGSAEDGAKDAAAPGSFDSLYRSMDAEGKADVDSLRGLIDNANAVGADLGDIDEVLAVAADSDGLDNIASKIAAANDDVSVESARAFVSSANARLMEARMAQEQASADIQVSASPDVEAAKGAMNNPGSRDDELRKIDALTTDRLDRVVTLLDQLDSPDSLTTLKSDPETGWLLEGVEWVQADTPKKRAVIRGQVEAGLRRESAIEAMQVLARVQPDMMNRGDLADLIATVDGLSPEIKHSVLTEWDNGMRHAVAARLADAGDSTIARLDDEVEGWREWVEDASTPRKEMSTGQVGSLIESEVPSFLSDAARKRVGASVRALKKSLVAEMPNITADALEVAMRQRARSAAAEIAISEWKKEMPSLAKFISGLKTHKAEAEGIGQELARKALAIHVANREARQDSTSRLGEIIGSRLSDEGEVSSSQLFYVAADGVVRAENGRPVSATGSPSAVQGAWQRVKEAGKAITRVFSIGDRLFVSAARGEKAETTTLVRRELITRWLADRDEMGEDAFAAKVAALDAETKVSTSEAEIELLSTAQQARAQIAQARASARSEAMALDADLPPAERAIEMAGIESRLKAALDELEPTVATAVQQLAGTIRKARAKGANPSLVPDGIVVVQTGKKGTKGYKRLELPAGAIVMEDGVVRFGDEPIGTYKAVDGTKRTVKIDGVDKEFVGITDGMSLLRRANFRKSVQDRIDAEVTRLREAHAQAKEGEVIAKGQSETGKIEKAANTLGIGQSVDEILSRPFSDLGVLPEGARWAVRRNDTGEVVRAFPSQTTPGQVLEDYKGDFTVGTVPAHRLEHHRAASVEKGKEGVDTWMRDTFQPMDSDNPISVDPQVASYARRVKDAKGMAPLIAQARSRALTSSEAGRIVIDGDGRSLLEIHEQFSHDSLHVNVSNIGKLEDYEELMKRLSDDAQILEKLLPHGLRDKASSTAKNNQNLQSSMNELRRIMSGQPTVAVEAALNALRRMDAQGREFPVLASLTRDGGGAYFPSHNVVGLGNHRAEGIASGSASDTLVHEIGHWAYTNLLSPGEQLEFLATLRKYYKDDGTFDINAALQDTPYLKNMDDLGYEGTGADTHLNELFAYQFGAYYHKKIADPNIEDTLWQKIVAKLSGLLAAIRGEKIKPELIPIFERILPSSIQNKRFHYGALRDAVSGQTVDVSSVSDGAARAAINVLELMEKAENARVALDGTLFNVTATPEDSFGAFKTATDQLFRVLDDSTAGESGKALIATTARTIQGTPVELIREMREAQVHRMKMDGATDMEVELFLEQGVSREMTLAAMSVPHSNPAVHGAFRSLFNERMEALSSAEGMSPESQVSDAISYALRGVSEAYPDSMMGVLKNDAGKLVPRQPGEGLGGSASRMYRHGIELRDLLHSVIDGMQAGVPAASGNQYYAVRSSLEIDRPLSEAVRATVNDSIIAARKTAVPVDEDMLSSLDMEGLAREGRIELNAATRAAAKEGASEAGAMEAGLRAMRPYLDEARRRMEAATDWPTPVNYRYERGTAGFEQAFGTEQAAEQTLRDAIAAGDADGIMEAGAIIREMNGKQTSVATDAARAADEATAETAAETVVTVNTPGADGSGQPSRRRATVAALISQISIREPVRRMFAQNLLAELVSRRGIVDVMTHEDLSAITGAPVPKDVTPGTAVATDTPAFRAFRGRLRDLAKVARKASLGEASGRDMAKAVGEIGEWLMPAGSVRGKGKNAPRQIIADLYVARKNGNLTPEQIELLKDGEIADALREAIEVVNIGMNGRPRANMEAGRVPTSTGVHPDFAKKRAAKMVDSLDLEETGHVSAALGMSYALSDKAQLLRGVLYRNPTTGRVSRESGIRSVVQEQWDSVGESDSPELHALMRALHDLDQDLRDRRDSMTDAKMAQLTEERSAIVGAISARLERDVDDGVEALLVNPDRILVADDKPTRTEVVTLVRAAIEASEGKLTPAMFRNLVGEEAAVAGVMNDVLTVIEQGISTKGRDDVLKNLGFAAVEQGGEITPVNPDMLRNLEDFIPDQRYLPEDQITGEGFGDALFAKMAEKDPNVRINAYGLENAVLEQGHSSSMAKAVTAVVTNRWTKALIEKAVDPRSQKLIQIRDNPSRMRKYDAHALADSIKEVYGGSFHVDRKLRQAELFAPVEVLLNDLDGIKGQLSNSFHVVRDIWMKDRERPSLRIGEALQGGAKSVARLSAKERIAAKTLVEQYRLAGEMMNSLGMEVGDVTKMRGQDYYQPQRFDLTEVANNREAAIEDFTRYFMEDGTPREEASASARKMIHTAIEAEEAAGYTEMPEFRSAVGRETHRRVLTLGDDRMAAGMSRWFEKDARVIATDYFSAVATRIESVKRWGVEAHGMEAYLEIGKRGTDAVVEMLTKRRMRAGAPLPAHGAEQAVQFERVLFDAVVETPAEARRLVESIEQAIVESKNKEAVKQSARGLLVAEYARRGGANPQFFEKQAEWIAAGIADFSIHGNALTKYEADFMTDAVHAQMGKGVYRLGKDHHKIRAAANGLSTVNALTLLPYATFSSLADTTMPLIRSGNMGAALKGIVGGAKAIAKFDPARKEAMMRLGISAEQSAQESMMLLNGNTAGKVTTTFFHLNLLTPWTSANREIAATTGFEMIKDLQISARRLRAKGMDRLSGAERVRYRSVMRNLRELGVGHLAEQSDAGTAIPELTDFVSMAKSGDERIRAAVHRFVDESVFQPTRADIPLWGQDPIGRVPFQLKSYMLMFQRMARRTLREATALERGDSVKGKAGELITMREILRNPREALKDANYAGNWRSLIALATAGAGMGMVTESGKDVIRARNQAGDETGESWASVQDRSLVKILASLGRDEESGPAVGDGGEIVAGKTADEIAGWYIEGMMSLGAMGLIGQMIHDAAQQADNGAYGKLRMLGVLTGPVAGVFTDAMDVGNWGAQAVSGAIFDGEQETNGTARQAVRRIVGRVPFVGGNVAAREGIVDSIAGESSR